MRERFETEAAEKMMHYRVANEDDTVQSSAGSRSRGAELLDEVANLGSDLFLQGWLAVGGDGELDAAHDVRAVFGLSIEGGLDGQDTAGLQVDKLGDQRGGAEVDGGAKPFLRREGERGVVGENGRF